jgi:hypothetical protein
MTVCRSHPCWRGFAWVGENLRAEPGNVPGAPAFTDLGDVFWLEVLEG